MQNPARVDSGNPDPVPPLIFSKLHLKCEKQNCPSLLLAPLTSNEVDSHCSYGFFRHHGLYCWSATKALLNKKIMWTPSIGHHGPLGVHAPWTLGCPCTMDPWVSMLHGPPVEKPCFILYQSTIKQYSIQQ